MKRKHLNIFIPLSILILFFLGIIKLENSSYNILWVNEYTHIFLETVGSFAIILVSLLLYTNRHELSFNTSSITIGLLLMGILDIFHGMIPLGQSFVFLHNIAGLIGGMGFFFFIFINIYKKEFVLSKFTIYLVILFGVVFGILSILYGSFLPLMIFNGVFTGFSIVINVITGFLFLTGCVYLLYLYYLKTEVLILILIITTFLLGISSLTFKYSEIWSTTWWLWHFLRFMGNVVLIYFVFDIAENRRKLVHIQNNEIKEINTKLNNYTYTISHDLKEPIRSIRTFSEFILEDYIDRLDETGVDYFNRIIIASNKMAAMIDDLLLISKIGRNDVEFEKISLKDILEDVLKSLEVVINETHAIIDYDNLPVIRCQITWMKLVFINLINNSLKYRDEDKASPRIKISCSGKRDYYEISIQDNGIGINRDQHDKIFGLFRRAYSKKDKEGSGAGLAIVKDIVKQHNGTVYVKESQLGVGTTMCFTIPKEGV